MFLRRKKFLIRENGGISNSADSRRVDDEHLNRMDARGQVGPSNQSSSLNGVHARSEIREFVESDSFILQLDKSRKSLKYMINECTEAATENFLSPEKEATEVKDKVSFIPRDGSGEEVN